MSRIFFIFEPIKPVTRILCSYKYLTLDLSASTKLPTASPVVENDTNFLFTASISPTTTTFEKPPPPLKKEKTLL